MRTHSVQVTSTGVLIENGKQVTDGGETLLTYVFRGIIMGIIPAGWDLGAIYIIQGNVY